MNLTTKNILKTTAVAALALPLMYGTAYATDTSSGTRGDQTGGQNSNSGGTGGASPTGDCCGGKNPSNPKSNGGSDPKEVSYICDAEAYRGDPSNRYSGSVKYDNQTTTISFFASKFPSYAKDSVSYDGDAVSLKDCKQKLIDEFERRGGKIKTGQTVTGSIIGGGKKRTSGKAKTPAPKPINTTMITTGAACLAANYLEEMRADLKKGTGTDVIVRGVLRDAVKYSFTDEQMETLKDCSQETGSFAISRRDNDQCLFPVKDGINPAIAFANGVAACPTSDAAVSTPVEPQVPAKEKVEAKTPAVETELTCDPKIATEDMNVTYMKDGVSHVFTIEAGNIQDMSCSNGVTYTITVKTQSIATLTEMVDGDYTNIVVAQDVSPANAPCAEVKPMCETKIQSSSDVLGIPRIKPSAPAPAFK